MARQMTAKERTPKVSEIARDIEATRRSLHRTVARIETELGRVRDTLGADALSAVKRAVIDTPTRRRPFMAVGVAAMAGLVAVWALGGRGARPLSLPSSHSTSRLKRGAALSVALLNALL